jgi:hypothetical protein
MSLKFRRGAASVLFDDPVAVQKYKGEESTDRYASRLPVWIDFT